MLITSIVNNLNSKGYLVLPVQGDPMPQKRLAKMAAAYYACKELFEMKELDDNLLPVRSLSDEESEEEDEEVDDKKAKIGTKKRRRRYERKVSKYDFLLAEERIVIKVNAIK